MYASILSACNLLLTSNHAQQFTVSKPEGPARRCEVVLPGEVQIELGPLVSSVSESLSTYISQTEMTTTVLSGRRRDSMEEVGVLTTAKPLVVGCQHGMLFVDLGEGAESITFSFSPASLLERLRASRQCESPGERKALEEELHRRMLDASHRRRDSMVTYDRARTQPLF